ncbi:hypothetical protein N0V93_002370 [Gnomoniopsis smithogilvyi]|uniref:Uncharacterized protein n=1 Tax=Gnomoniopsis smithogilvyi TaxID=1191159 RepID=A0A9W9CZ03_9PEZI|nr:hypothetical protein N0V93_002370 [Gnomoniopsis smithogilvyi]
MLPPPALTFTIPSIHDDTTLLDCRIYHPASLAPNQLAPVWRKHAAIVAHPYATLGGSYDDAVVETVSAALLREGYVVGTFNFRGAGNSTGKTSWTGKAERGDYMSFAGFVAYYVHYLDPFRPQSEPRSPASVSMPTNELAGNMNAVLLLCGYSYGAMITQHLPPLTELLVPFATPPTASAAADIRLRAQHLAEKQNTILASARLAASTSHRHNAFGGMRVGGDEDPRRSQEHGSRRSFSMDAEEKIRKGVAELMRAAKGGHHLGAHHRDKKGNRAGQKHVKEMSESAQQVETKEPETLPAVEDLVVPRVAYLLVSPPVGWATNLMTMNMGGFFGKRPKTPKTKNAGATASRDTAEMLKLVENPTLAIYGDADIFVAVKKFREWASKMQAEPGSKFRAHEISTAGHFYVEQGTLQRLAEAVKAFSGELAASE